MRLRSILLTPIVIALLCGTSSAQMLTTMNVSLADGTSVAMQLTRTNVHTPNGDPADFFIKIEGVDGEQTSGSGSVEVLAIPLDLVGSSLATLTTSATLSGIAVLTRTTTVQDAESAAAQIAHVQLVFRQTQLPTTVSASTIGALTTIASSLTTMVGGTPLPEKEGAPVAQLIEALGLPSPCPPTTVAVMRSAKQNNRRDSARN
jgi:hypothetical protein